MVPSRSRRSRTPAPASRLNSSENLRLLPRACCSSIGLPSGRIIAHSGGGRTVSALREWRRIQLEERLRAGEAWKSGELVVADEFGAYLRPAWLGKRFVALSEAAGLRTITIRQLRHSHATALLFSRRVTKGRSRATGPLVDQRDVGRVLGCPTEHAARGRRTTRTDVQDP